MKLKAITLIVLFLTLSNIPGKAQVNGTLASNSQITTVKVWGSNYQMGYAYGYYLGQSVHDLIKNYLKPTFGAGYSTIRTMVSSSVNINISNDYQSELAGIIDAMNATGVNTNNYDQTDLIIANSFLDIAAFSKKGSDMGCSALMSWGDATMNSSLNGKSVITRHLDWSTNQYLLNSMVLCVHLPQDTLKRPWLSLGFSGIIGALSAMNSDMGIFQNMMSDYSGTSPSLGKGYTPVWLCLRDAIETKDPNGDGHTNTEDLKYVLNQQTNGFATAVLISALSRSTENNDSLIAMVAELALSSPMISYRNNSLPDSISGDNLYLANEQIIRNNSFNFSTRYTKVMNAMDTIADIDIDKNWDIMKNYSAQSGNLMSIQFAPEIDLLRFSLYDNSTNLPAYQVAPTTYSLTNLLSTSDTLSISEMLEGQKPVYLYPNPCTTHLCINITHPEKKNVITVMDVTGKTVLKMETTQKEVEMINVEYLPDGLYIVDIRNDKETIREKVLKQ